MSSIDDLFETCIQAARLPVFDTHIWFTWDFLLVVVQVAVTVAILVLASVSAVENKSYDSSQSSPSTETPQTTKVQKSLKYLEMISGFVGVIIGAIHIFFFHHGKPIFVLSRDALGWTQILGGAVSLFLAVVG